MQLDQKIREEIAKQARLAVNRLYGKDIEVPLVRPAEEFGDFATPVALSLTKDLKRSPFDIAREIASALPEIPLVAQVSAVQNGFINFSLTPDVYVDILARAAQDNYLSYKQAPLRSSRASKGRVMFEFGQPNTHKLPHIGHLFSYIYGEAMVRILEANGFSVFRANYQGDIGLHVAKCLWAFLKEDPAEPQTLAEKVTLLQRMYQTGSAAYDKDEIAKSEINDLNKKIYDGDVAIRDIWQKTRQWSIDYYQEFEKRLGVRYDRYYFESEVYAKGKEIARKNIPGVFAESQGAVIFPGSRHGLHDRVFVTKYDTPTYEAKDLFLQTLKKQEWPADLLVIATAAEQNEYFRVIFKALEILDPWFSGKLKHIGFGMINLSTGKMSSRTGNILGAIDLVDLVVSEEKKVLAGRAELTDGGKEEIAETVGIGAAKYFMLRSDPLSNISFDVKESISLEGNSGPYLQYTCVRTRSVLEKLKTDASSDTKLEISEGEMNTEEILALRSLAKIPEAVEKAADRYSPAILCNQLFDLAQRYNLFYNRHRILEAEDETRTRRIALTRAVGNALTKGLHLLGISVPERM